MNLKTIKLESEKYHEYVEGKEVRCPAAAAETRELQEGEHVLVFKDTVTANTSVSPPRGEMQSEYIGVEGMVTRSGSDEGDGHEIMIRRL